MRRWLLLLMVVPLAMAQTLVPQSVHIFANIVRTPLVEVKEEYYFPPSEVNQISAMASSFGYSYQFWKKHVVGFYPHLCPQEAEKGKITITLREKNGLPLLSMYYTCRGLRKLREDLFFITYVLDAFSFPVVSGLLRIPENTTVEVYLPPEASLEDVEPSPTKKDHEIVWTGPISTVKRLKIVFSVPKTYRIPSISDLFLRWMRNPRIAFLLLALAIIAYGIRDKIKKEIIKVVSRFTDLEKE